MDMQFTIAVQDLEGSLQIAVSGSYIEFSGFAHGRKVAIEEDAGKVTVRVTSVAELHPVVERVQDILAVPAVEPKEITEVEPHVESLSLVPESADYLLFQQLAALRKQISSEVKLPPYIIFHDTTLKEMCRILPTDLQGLKTIPGVGTAKLEKYGARFVESIREHVSSHGTEGVA